MNLKIDKLRWPFWRWPDGCSCCGCPDVTEAETDTSEYLVIVLLESYLQTQTQELGIQVGCPLAFFPVALIDHIDTCGITLHKGTLALPTAGITCPRTWMSQGFISYFLENTLLL